MNKHNLITFSALILLCLTAFLSGIFLKNEKYMLVATIGAFISMVPFFVSFENKKHSTREIVIIAVMIAICVAGRFIFTAIPHFKPVTALVIITGMYFGSEAGFLTGSLTALVSNMQFGQGPWTVFQMAVWGLIGFFSGIINKRDLLSEKKLVLSLYAGLCGVIFSLLMDIYTTIGIDSGFSVKRYLFYVSSSLPVMLEYIVSNIVFVLLCEKPIGRKLNRIKTKYGIF